MATRVGRPFDNMKQPHRVLVLDDDENALIGIVELLREAGYHVTGTTAYEEAKRLLSTGSVDLLISDIRLRGFNGLNLIRHAHRENPDTSLMIMTGFDEPMIELEAGRYGAEFVRKPFRPAEFYEAVTRALSKVRRQRRWPRKQVLGGFKVTAAGKPAAVVDVCYGGLRLQIPSAQSVPPTFDVEVSGIDLHLEVQPVWWHHSQESDAVLCGAALASDSTPAARTWRAIVDRLSA